MQKPRFSLPQKALLAVIVILLPIFITFLVTYRANRDHLKRIVLDDVKALAGAYYGQIYQFLRMSRGRAEVFSSDGFIVRELEELVSGRKPSAASLNEYLLRNKLPIDKTIIHIDIISMDGVVVASTDPSEMGREFSAKRFFASGREGGSIVEDSELHAGTPVIAASAPIYSRNGSRPLGVLANFIRLSELDTLLGGGSYGGAPGSQHSAGRHRSMKAYLVNRDGRIIAGGERVQGEAAAGIVVDTPPVHSCRDEKSGMAGFYTDYRGEEVVGGSECLDELGWTLLVEVDSADVMAPLKKIRRGVVTTGFIVTGLMGLLYMAFLRGVVGGLRKITDAAGEIASGRYDTTVEVRSSDELGRLSESFNGMAKQIRERTAELKESRRALSTLMSNLPGIVYRCRNDMDRTMEFVSDGCMEMTGYSPEELVGNKVVSFGRDLVHPADRENVWKAIQSALNEKRAYGLSYRIRTAKGEDRWVWDQGRGVYSHNGELLCLEGFISDITGRKMAEQELKILSTAIEQSINIIFITNTKGVIEYVNRMFEEVTGYSREEAIGQTPRILSSGETPNVEYEELWRTITSGNTWRGIFKNKKKNGEFYWSNGGIFPVKNEDGEITHFLAVQEDITEKMRSKERISQLTSYDMLTGLLNRSRFMELIDEWIGSVKGDGARGVLLLIDMDQFKLINDVYGHGLGDEMLRQTARLLDVTLRHIDVPYMKKIEDKATIARLGGDEFAVFLPSLDRKEGMEVAEYLRRIVEEFRSMDLSVQMTVTIGAAVFPDHGTTVKELFTKADAAMYHAKELGRNRVHLFSEEDRVLEELHSRLKWKGRILKALEEDRFETWFQPILSVKERTVHHYEVLVRMRNPDGGILIPGAFIDIAESFGIIGSIDRVITEKAMRIQAELSRKGRPLTFCINLSGKDLGDEDFLTFLSSKIAETGASPSNLVFELTETAAVYNLDEAKAFIKELKSIGCSFSLDDFGVGFSSFRYLQELGVDYIKIDGSFVKKITENGNDRLFVKAIADIARGMGIRTIAEFVENEEILELLEELGVDYAQGYHTGRPRPFVVFD